MEEDKFEEELEKLYWNFDHTRNNVSQPERETFKNIVRYYMNHNKVDCGECANRGSTIVFCTTCKHNKKLTDNFTQRKKEWYEDIPDRGRICRVWSGEPDESTLRLIKGCKGGIYYTDSGVYWKKAEPLTDDEISKYLSKG